MSPVVTARVALRALARNKTRTFLTMLGIVIGVSAVIAMVAIGEGAKVKVQQSFASMGTNLLILLPGSTTSGGMRGGFGSMPTITWDDLRAVRTEVPGVRYAAPELRSNVAVVADQQNWTTRVVGTSPEYLDLRNWQVSLGAPFSETDAESGAKVMLMGTTVVTKLWGESANPIGQTVRIRNTPFEVVGVLASKGQSQMGQDNDDVVIVPTATFRSKIQGGLGQFVGGAVMIGAATAEDIPKVQARVTDLLRDRHHIEIGADDDFSIRNLSEIASAMQEGTKTMTSLLAAIAAVSLLVGGIGIMNIMLVSVTERTREIGVRMAVGAKPRHILAQFLTEALVLAVAGGILGVALGVWAGQALSSRFGWPLLVRADVVVLSVVFSAAVGIGFGLYPALKASRLDPIDALRYE